MLEMTGQDVELVLDFFWHVVLCIILNTIMPQQPVPMDCFLEG